MKPKCYALYLVLIWEAIAIDNLEIEVYVLPHQVAGILIVDVIGGFVLFAVLFARCNLDVHHANAIAFVIHDLQLLLNLHLKQRNATSPSSCHRVMISIAFKSGAKIHVQLSFTGSGKSLTM